MIKKKPKWERLEYLTDRKSGSVSFKEFDSFWRYQVVCIVGSQTIHSTVLNPKGILSKLGEGTKLPGRILNIFDD